MRFLIISLFLMLVFPVRGETIETTLQNGLKVIIKNDHRSPVAIQMLFYRVGSIDEETGKTGLSHLLEHLMFKGTQLNPSGFFSRKVAELGGVDNAFTYTDATAYYQKVPKTALREIMLLEADRMKNLTFSLDEFLTERDVVLEERRMRVEDVPFAVLRESFMNTALSISGERNPVIGSMKDLKKLSWDDARKWYQDRYAPNNATLVLLGDIDPSQTLTQVKEIYGKILPASVPKINLQAEPKQKIRREVEVMAPVELFGLKLGWKVPRYDSSLKNQEEFLALHVLADILGGTQVSRLPKLLVRDKQVAQSISVDYDGLGRSPTGLFTINAQVALDGDSDVLQSLILSQLEEIQSKGVSLEELFRAKNRLASQKVFEQDSLISQAIELGTFSMLGLGSQTSDQIIKALQTVTAHQVQSVAKKYFMNQAMTVARLKSENPDSLSAQMTFSGIDLMNQSYVY